MAGAEDKIIIQTLINPLMSTEGVNVNPQQTNVFRNGKSTHKLSSIPEEGKTSQD